VPPSPRRATILVVEDDAALRDLYRTELTMAGYAVVAVADGVTALASIDTATPDAIVLDWGLPCLSGGDVQRELAAHADTRDIPVILVTGVASDETINFSDFSCVIRKPVDLSDLLAAVRKCVSRSDRGGV
jgi:two-component system phosphate regulon response regulator PhoB